MADGRPSTTKPTTGEHREELIARLAAQARLVLVIGEQDSGKTTFCARLASMAAAAGRRAAVIDADIGQSEIGPPACVGMAFAEAETHAIGRLRPVATAFVGAVSATDRQLEHVAAVCDLCRRASAMGADVIVVDTTGFVEGPSARRLKRAKAAATGPSDIVVLTRRRTPGLIFADLARSAHHRIHRVAVDDAVVPRPTALRSERRAGQFARALTGASERVLDLSDVRIQASWLCQGAPLPAHERARLGSALGRTVIHAEREGGHIGAILAGGQPPRPGPDVMARIECASVTLYAERRASDVLAGLHDPNGGLLGLGLTRRWDFRRYEMTVLTPITSTTAIASVSLGLLRLEPNGVEIERIGQREL